MTNAIPHASFVELKRDEASSILSSLVMSRALETLAVSVSGWVACCALLAPEPWRRGLLVATAAAMLGTHWFYRYRITRPGQPTYAASVHLLMYVLQSVSLVATGGLNSPLLFALLFPQVFIPSFVYEWAMNRWMAVVLCGLIWLLALVQGQWLQGDPLLFIKAGATSVTIAVAFYLGRRIRAVHDRMMQQLLASRDETRRSYEERLKEQTVLAGEIAHELKNPLASIKGLAELCHAENEPGRMAEPLQVPGRMAERLQVLRGEVARMQGILEGFLNFSRPLLPLCQQQVDLGELCTDVVELHEGLARGRGVSLVLDCAAQVRARCDPRKVKQVVINLLQNAIEASPPGELVRVGVALAGDSARITVLDRGPGLPPEALRDQPGFTTKEGGSGLGLKIARSLVAQHQGRLALGERAGGGCAAEIRLPLAGVPESPSGGEA